MADKNLTAACKVVTDYIAKGRAENLKKAQAGDEKAMSRQSAYATDMNNMERIAKRIESGYYGG